MSSKIYIDDASSSGEIRIAVVEGGNLVDLNIERQRLHKKGSIYRGTVTKVEESQSSLYVNFGSDRDGTLPFSRAGGQALAAASQSEAEPAAENPRPDLPALKKGDEILVQITTEARNGKGAQLTAKFSIPGVYLILFPKNSNMRSVPKFIEGSKRNELEAALKSLVLPAEMGVLARSNALGKEVELLQQELNILVKLWNVIERASSGVKSPFLLFEEGNPITTTLRDMLRRDVQKVLLNSEKGWKTAMRFATATMPDFASRIEYYQESYPMFSQLGIEAQIRQIYDRKVILDSGASIVFDHTEALLAIDVNSGGATSQKNIAETALAVNLQAADEICRQLRLRDIGGLIVIDFIDMEEPEKRLKVEEAIRKSIKRDRAQIRVEPISAFGLVEMTRQRVRPSVLEADRVTCPSCSGKGVLPTRRHLATTILRDIENFASKKAVSQVWVTAAPEIINQLFNANREDIELIEENKKIAVSLCADRQIALGDYQIEPKNSPLAIMPRALDPNSLQAKAKALYPGETQVLKVVAKPGAAVELVYESDRDLDRESAGDKKDRGQGGKSQDKTAASASFFSKLKKLLKDNLEGKANGTQAPAKGKGGKNSGGASQDTASRGSFKSAPKKRSPKAKAKPRGKKPSDGGQAPKKATGQGSDKNRSRNKKRVPRPEQEAKKPPGGQPKAGIQKP